MPRMAPQLQDTPFIAPVLKQPSVSSPIPFLIPDSGSSKKKKEKQKKKQASLLKKEQQKKEQEEKSAKASVESAQVIPSADNISTYDTATVFARNVVKDTLVKKHLDSPTRFYTESLFKGHLLQTHDRDLKLKLNIKNHQYWIPALLLFALAVYAFARIRYFKRVDQIKGAFSIGGFNRRSREENVLFTRASILLMGLSLLVLALFIFHVITYYSLSFIQENKLLLFIKMVILIMLIYFVKGTVIRLVGFVFKVENESKEYLINIFLFNELLGLLLLPVVIGLTYVNAIPTQYLINTGIIVIGFTLIYRTVKVIILSLAHSKISKFYFFLYLCTLEILPLIVLAKLLNIKISL